MNGHPYQDPMQYHFRPSSPAHSQASMTQHSNLSPVITGKWLTDGGSKDAEDNHHTTLQPMDPHHNLDLSNRYHGAPMMAPSPQYGFNHFSPHQQIHADVVVGERRDSNVSELDNFSFFREPTVEDGHLEDYNDSEIEGLLDPEPISNSSISVHTSSTQGTDDNQKGSSLAGLSIDVGEEDDYIPETGALLGRAEQGKNYSSLEDTHREPS